MCIINEADGHMIIVVAGTAIHTRSTVGLRCTLYAEVACTLLSMWSLNLNDYNEADKKRKLVQPELNGLAASAPCTPL